MITSDWAKERLISFDFLYSFDISFQPWIIFAANWITFTVIAVAYSRTTFDVINRWCRTSYIDFTALKNGR